MFCLSKTCADRYMYVALVTIILKKTSTGDLALWTGQNLRRRSCISLIMTLDVWPSTFTHICCCQVDEHSEWKSVKLFPWNTNIDGTFCPMVFPASVTITAFDFLMSQSELPRPVPWNQTLDVHRGFTLITWSWRHITWRWRQRTHANTITKLVNEYDQEIPQSQTAD